MSAPTRVDAGALSYLGLSPQELAARVTADLEAGVPACMVTDAYTDAVWQMSPADHKPGVVARLRILDPITWAWLACPKCEQASCDGLCRPRTQAQQAADKRRREKATRERFARDMATIEARTQRGRGLRRSTPIIVRRNARTGAGS